MAVGFTAATAIVVLTVALSANVTFSRRAAKAQAKVPKEMTDLKSHKFPPADMGVNGTDGHVCCNTTLTQNAVGKATDGPGVTKNVLTTTTAKLVGDSDSGIVGSNVGSRWNFTTELFVEIAADSAPTAAAVRPPVIKP